jgi:hypothetical protein
MLKLFRKLGGPVVLMAAVAGCGGMDMTSFLNASAVPTNTDIPFRSGIQYSAPRGFCATDAQTFQEEAKGFGVFVTCFGAYDRSRLLTVAHYPIDPNNPPAIETLIQAAGFGAMMQRIVENDGAIYARLKGDLNDQDLQPEFNRMITQKGGYVIMANLYARARASNTDFMARQVLAQVLKGINTDSSKMPQFVRYLPTDPMVRPKLRP